MLPRTLQALRARSSEIRSRWETLLRIEPVNGALAQPDVLVHLIPTSLDKIFRDVAKGHVGHVTLESAHSIALPVCGCHCNPYIAYFSAGEQALSEQMILLQAESQAGQGSHEELAEVIRSTRRLAADEIGTFCTICTHRGKLRGCRFHSAA